LQSIEQLFLEHLAKDAHFARARCVALPPSWADRGAFLPECMDSGADEQGEGSSGDAESYSRAGRSSGSATESGTSRRETEGDEAGGCCDAGGGRIEETLYYYVFPREHWRSLRTNNPLARLLREVRRRTRAVGAFPDGKSALMLAAARLRHVAGTNWGIRRYLDMKSARWV
jgi:hypothetical protein